MLRRTSLPRVVAGFLAVAGLVWSFVLLHIIDKVENPTPALLTFLPGFIVTVGYIIRALITPRRTIRRLIWFLSVLVQGGWLTFGVIVVIANGRFSLFFFWWLAAFVLSIIALNLDQ